MSLSGEYLYGAGTRKADPQRILCAELLRAKSSLRAETVSFSLCFQEMLEWMTNYVHERDLAWKLGVIASVLVVSAVLSYQAHLKILSSENFLIPAR